MTVKTRGTTFYIDVTENTPEGEEIRVRQAVGKDRGEAERQEAEVRLQIRSGQYKPATGGGKNCRTLGGALEEAKRQLWRNLRETDIHLTRVRILTEIAGDWPLGSFDVNAQARLVDKLRERDVSDATVRRYLEVLSPALNLYGVSLDKTLKKRLKKPRARETIIHTDLWPKIIEYVSKRRGKSAVLEAFFQFLYLTGARPGETLKLRVMDVVGESLRFHSQTTKSGAPKVLHQDEAVQGLLQELVKGKRPGDKVFDITKQTYKRAWQGVRTHFGIEDRDFVPYAIRHTVATELVGSVPLGVAAKVLGHADVAMTMRYTHLSTADTRAALTQRGQKVVP